jgi:hypothetical protein
LQKTRFTNKDIVDFLGGFLTKNALSVMGAGSTGKSIKKIKGETIEDEQEERERLSCLCFCVTENVIRRVIRENILPRLRMLPITPKLEVLAVHVYQKLRTF